ncbi:SusC/RagA family TonB-linked outer membrane protein [Chitinophaga sp. sic0106]|uniref:SusC/RagA family TonB-linked outer membrane protein n=1 Tax=Chitinophaga sp. sic0106 TaxID=2854785 RepID=UPI001C47E4C1|nr:SusC/RagA family TonB-linked outer membrane protein [Chitinophaga sp. sic0106]MBV7530540.1 SusC/RagA family TonB-linked outer membrane protein [Chitinophaga sp. sic0106]
MRLLKLCCCLFLLLGVKESSAQNGGLIVSGTVKDSATKEPLIGVSIAVAGKAGTGTATGADGHFTLKLASGNETLLFRMMNYATRSIPVNNRANIDIILASSSSQLGEILVVGYTEQSVKKNTAAISKMDIAELKNNPNPNPVQAMQGKIAGVSIPINQGQPGVGASNIIIRGGTKPNVYGTGLGNNNGAQVGSVEGTSPLVVVDGVFRSINDINPDDIESMQVMKDAASTAIYGARGANGVIVIRTKRGKLNTRSTVTLNHRTTWETQARDYDYLSAAEYLRLARTTVANTDDALDKNNLLYNAGFSAGTKLFTQKGQFGKSTYLTALYDNIVQVEGQAYVDNLLANGWQTMEDPINPGSKLLFADNHYQDMLWNTGISNQDNVTLSGGTDKADYNFSMGYTNQKGVLVGTKYQRYNALGNFGYRASDNLKLDFMINYQNVIPNYVDAYQNDLVRAIRITPLIRTFKDNGDPALGELYTVRNRFHTLKYDDMRTNTERMVSRVGADLTITKGLHWRPSVSYVIDDYTELFMRKATPADEIQPAQQRWKDDYTNASRQLMLDQVLQYDFSLRTDHHFSALAGMNFTRNTNHSKDMGSQRAANDYVYTIEEDPTTSINGQVVSNVMDFRTALGESRSASVFGQFSYDYQMRYLLGGSLRYDGFSNFAPGNKYALFPSLSAGWNIDQEKFWHSNLVSSLKLRASWGAAGLSGLSIADTYGAYSNVSYALNSGILRAGLSNPNLRWESTVTTDIAIDAGLFNNRLNVSLDYYNKLTNDRLTTKPLPSEAPFPDITYNNGSLRNRGIEVAVGGTVIKSKSFSWNANLTFAYNRTTITALPANGRAKNRQGGDVIYDKSSKSLVEAGGLAVGERPYAIYAYNVLGVFATDEEAAAWNSRVKDNLASPQGIKVGKRGGDFIFEDVNNDGVIDTKDQVFIGYRNPDKMGGLQNTFTYKGIALRVNADYAIGHMISNGALARSMGQGRAFNEGAPAQALAGDVWKQQGDQGMKYARFSFADYDYGQRNYLRNATLGNNNSYNSDVSVMYEKGDFLALREITLSYDIPAAILKRAGISGLNISGSVYNVGYLTAYKGLNPEIYSGFDPGGYPRPRQFSLGANLRF